MTKTAVPVGGGDPGAETFRRLSCKSEQFDVGVPTVDGKVVIVTGATDGIGRATAKALAARGASVTIVGRNPLKGNAAVAGIRADTGNNAVCFHQADLSSQSDVRRLARAIMTQGDRLDVLVNNAGGLFASRMVSVDGIEMTFALNHLAYFLLTNLLLEQLQATPGARIVNVASHAHVGTDLDIDDLQFSHRYNGWTAYKRSKLCNLLFTYELARKLGNEGPTVNALHPGFVRSHLGQGGTDNSAFWRSVATLVFRFTAAITPEKGAETSIHLAASPDLAGVTGKYFTPGVGGHSRAPGRAATSSAVSRDPDIAARLWEISAELTSL